MTSKKRFILSVDQGKLVLPQALIPENTRDFVCELQEDGRILLSPLTSALRDSSERLENSEPHQVHSDFSNVLDFETSRARLRKQMLKPRESAALPESEKAGASTGQTHFVKLCFFSSRLEAEMLGEILKQSEIPYLIQSEDIGLFGPGAVPVPGGARIVVRQGDLEYARIILSGLI